MPRIPEYRRQTSAPNGVDFRRAPMGGGIGQGLQEIGQVVSGMEQSYDKYQRQQGAHNAAQKTSQFALEDDQEVTSAVESYNPNEYKKPEGKPDGYEFADEVQEKLEEKNQRRLAEVDNSYERQELDLRLSTVKSKLVLEARTKQKSVEAKYVKENAVKTQTQYANLVRSNPGKLEDGIGMMNDYYDTLPERYAGVKDLMKQESTQVLYDSALDGKVTALAKKSNLSPYEVTKLRNEIAKEGSSWQKNSSKEKYDQSLTQLASLEKQARLQTDFNSKVDFDDEMKRITEFGVQENYKTKFTDQYINSTSFTPKQKENMIRVRDESLAIGKQLNTFKSMPFSEIEKKLSVLSYREKVDKDPSKSHVYIAERDAGIKAYKQMRKEYADDPIKYMENLSPGGKEFFENFRASIDKAQSPEEINSLVTGYVSKVTSIQENLDPNQTPKLLSKDDTDRMRNLLSSANINKSGAQEVFSVLQKESQKWGPHFPQIVQEYRQDKAMDFMVAIAASNMGDKSKLPLVQDIITVSKLAKSELDNNYSSGEKDTDITASSQAALKPFLDSMPNTLEGQQLKAAYVDMESKMYKFYGGKKSHKELSELIVKDQYEFTRISGKSIRMPKDKVKDFDKAEDNLDFILSNVKNRDLIPGDSGMGLTPEDNKKEYKSRIYNSGRLENDGDEGVILVDANGQSVYEADPNSPNGIKAVRFTWDQILNLKTK